MFSVNLLCSDVSCFKLCKTHLFGEVVNTRFQHPLLTPIEGIGNFPYVILLSFVIFLFSLIRKIFEASTARQAEYWN